jgi:hypothetical protein
MSTAQEIVTDAFGLLVSIDIVETAPSPTEMTKGLRVLSQMIDSWATEGLSIADQTRTCVLDGTTGVLTGMVDPLTSLVDVLKLAPGMNANGTGIPVGARILGIDDASKRVQLDMATMIAGSSVAVTFTALPFAAKFERGVAALLAMQLAPLVGEDNVPPMTARIAQSGWTALQANFMRIPPVGFDPALVLTSIQRTTGAIPSG